MQRRGRAVGAGLHREIRQAVGRLIGQLEAQHALAFAHLLVHQRRQFGRNLEQGFVVFTDNIVYPKADRAVADQQRKRHLNPLHRFPSPLKNTRHTQSPPGARRAVPLRKDDTAKIRILTIAKCRGDSTSCPRSAPQPSANHGNW